MTCSERRSDGPAMQKAVVRVIFPVDDRARLGNGRRNVWRVRLHASQG